MVSQTHGSAVFFDNTFQDILVRVFPEDPLKMELPEQNLCVWNHAICVMQGLMHLAETQALSNQIRKQHSAS
jgi:hypothetical protein